MIKATQEQAEIIKDWLIKHGGEERNAPGGHEVWRVSFSDAVITYYTNGTLLFQDRELRDPAVFEALAFIQEVVGPFFEPPTRRYLIGLDEAGKGEMFGHLHLAGLMIDAERFDEFAIRFLNVDTKKKAILDTWNRLSSQIVAMGAVVQQDSIPPWDIDRYKVNELLDIAYQRILNRFFRTAPISESRIVIDDYGIGPTLNRFLNFLEQNGAEVVRATKADEQYLEARLASIIAKTERERLIHAINVADEFVVGGKRPGSGNSGDPKTLAWLEAWPRGKPLPWFVRRSWSTLAKYHPDQAVGGKKRKPPIDTSLLSPDFLSAFEQGKFDIHSLSIVCPHCGSIAKQAIIVFDGEDSSSLRCPECRRPIPLLANTLRYYCGHAVVDSNAVIQRVVSRDLARPKGRNYRDFFVHVPYVVRVEVGNKKEFDELSRFSQMRRIRFELGGPDELPAELKDRVGAISSDERDEIILDYCERLNALVITADKGMKGRALTRGIFCIATV